jgi:hypothetical protein
VRPGIPSTPSAYEMGPSARIDNAYRNWTEAQRLLCWRSTVAARKDTAGSEREAPSESGSYSKLVDLAERYRLPVTHGQALLFSVGVKRMLKKR